MTRVTLSKYEYMWPSDGGQRTHPNGYTVSGLPTGEEATINNFGAPQRKDWQILRSKGDVWGERYGHFASADAALASLEADINCAAK
jgi:hypothetical protein